MSKKADSKDIVKQEVSEFLKRCDDKGNSLLHYIVKSDDVEFAKHLIAVGCDVNKKNNKGNPPLLLAIRENQLEMVKILLNAGADYQNDNFKHNRGPLHLAADYGFPKIVELLLENGAVVNAKDDYGFTPLHRACTSGRDNRCSKIIKYLLDAGADVNAKDCIGWTSFARAANNDYCEAFELMSTGADILLDGDMALTLLDAALSGGSEKIIPCLIELGVDINLRFDNGDTCLHEAAEIGQFDMIDCLFQNGAMISVNNDGWDPLCKALAYWDFEGCELSETSDDRDKEIEENQELYSDYMESFELLLNRGSNVNNVTNDGKSPLYIVLERYKLLHSSFVRVLLKNGAQFDFNHPSVLKVINESNGSKFPHLLLRHQAMFEEAQDRTNAPVNFDVGKLNEKSREDFARCQKELQSMKATKIGDTNVTFLKLLVNRDIGPYARNECVINAFDPKDVSSKFPIYSDLVVERFSYEVEFQKLVKAATDSLASLVNWDRNSNILLLSKIIEYLDKKELTSLSLI